MSRIIDHRRVARLLQSASRARIARRKGALLEDAICYVFGRIPGITVTRKNQLNAFDSEEIDVAFWNDKAPDGLHFLPDIILVECKNWAKPVSSEQVGWFDTKLRNRGVGFGVLVATNGITGEPRSITAAHQVIAAALRENRRMIVVKSEELRSLRRTDWLIHLIKEKICDLVVSGTVLTDQNAQQRGRVYR